jgi:hypothetical protein
MAERVAGSTVLFYNSELLRRSLELEQSVIAALSLIRVVARRWTLNAAILIVARASTSCSFRRRITFCLRPWDRGQRGRQFFQGGGKTGGALYSVELTTKRPETVVWMRSPPPPIPASLKPLILLRI